MKFGCKNLWHACQGLAAIEFAVVAPLMLVIMVGTADVGRIVYTGMQMNQVAHEAAMIAMRQPNIVSATEKVQDYLDQKVPSYCIQKSTCVSEYEVNNGEFCTPDDPCIFLVIDIIYDVTLLFDVLFPSAGTDLVKSAMVQIQ